MAIDKTCAPKGMIAVPFSACGDCAFCGDSDAACYGRRPSCFGKDRPDGEPVMFVPDTWAGSKGARLRAMVELASGAYDQHEPDMLLRVLDGDEAMAADGLATFVVQELREMVAPDEDAISSFLAAGNAMVDASNQLLAVARAMLRAAETALAEAP